MPNTPNSNSGKELKLQPSSSPYSSPYFYVQFIGYAISTVPKLYVENPAQPGTNKYYLGLEDETADIEARLELLSIALNTAQQAFQADADVFRIFVIPEFFFRGSKGAYSSSQEKNLTARLQAILQEKAPDIGLAVFGTSLFCPEKVDYAHPSTAKNFTLGDDFLNIYRSCHDYQKSLGLSTPSMQEMLFYLDELECLQDEHCTPNKHHEPGKPTEQSKQQVHGIKQSPTHTQTLAPRTPLEAILQEVLASSDREAPLVVSNQCQIFLYGERYLRVQKKFKSKVDFVLNYYCDSARKQKNHNAYLQTFVKYPSIPNINSELKTNDLDPYGIFQWNGLKIGVEICLDHIRQRMSKKTNDLDLQIIPSCGVEITLNGVAARPGGYVFNCDGDYNLEDAQNGLGSHTQLYQVKQAHSGATSDSSLPRRQHAKLGDRIHPKQIIKIEPPNKKHNNNLNVESLFPFGAGELHVYPALALATNK